MARNAAPVLLLLALLLAAAASRAHAGCLKMPSLLKPDTYPTQLVIRKAADGTVVTKLCPGVDYKVTVTFPEAREFMLKATSGIFDALTGACTNQTSSSIATTSITKTLSMPCDIMGTFAFDLASKVPSSLVFLSKTFSLPINPLASCPKSRCTVSNGTTAFAGLPVFDLFSGLGVLPNLTPSNTLNFSITSLPKVVSVDSFFKVLGSLAQFKMAKASLLADPTLLLSVLQQLSGAVNTTGVAGPKLAMVAEVKKLLTLWPNFAFAGWNTTKLQQAGGAFGLDVSSFTDAFAAIIPAESPSNLFGTFKSPAAPAESLLGIVNTLGELLTTGCLGVGGAVQAQAQVVPLDSFMALLGSYTSLLGVAKVA